MPAKFHIHAFTVIALLTGSLGAGSALAGPEAEAEPTPTTLEVADGVYAYGPGDHYYSMFVATDECVVAIEPVNSDHARGMLAAIRAVTDKPVSHLLHSHNHWDHAGGGQVFADAGAKSLVHAEAYAWMKANPHPDMRLPDYTWDGARKDLSVCGVTIEMHYLGMNHGLGMTIFRLPAQKVAYIADLVTPNRVLFSVVPDFNIREWERSLHEILALDFDTAIFSHNALPNALAGGTKAHVQESLDFVNDLRNAPVRRDSGRHPPDDGAEQGARPEVRVVGYV